MKRKIARKIAKQKKKVEKQLAKARSQSGARPTLRASNIHYELPNRAQAICHGGIGAIHMLVKQLGLIELLDQKVQLLKQHRPYHESDHVLNIAYNVLCGGRVLDDIEFRRNDLAYLKALGTQSIPDPTTAGDFCRRFEQADLEALQEAINLARLKVWEKQPPEFFKETARIDADGTLVETHGECKEGIDISYKGVWGYHPLLVSLANTQEPLFLLNRSGNRPSHEGVVPLFDKSIELCREAGFSSILLRGDTDFSLTSELDRWDDDGVHFVFGYDAFPNLKTHCEALPEPEYEELVRQTEQELKTKPRCRPENVKEKIVVEREFKNIKLKSEQVVEFDYTPTNCNRSYRMIALRKNLSVEKGELVLFDEFRYFFYITNHRSLSKEEVVFESNQRCNQENLIAQLQGGVRALHAPVNTLNANWAYMVMASLAWSLKAWAGLMLPVNPRWKEKHTEERELVIQMEFRTFLNAFMNVPAQIVQTGRKLVYRLLSWNPWQHIFFRLFYALRE